MSHDNGHNAQPPLVTSKIGALHIRIRKEFDKIFRQMEFPVEMDQIPVLVLLYYGNGMSQQEICSTLQRDKASVNRTVSFLSKKNMAKVIQDVTDKRKTRVELTAAGKEMAKQADAILKKFDAVMISSLTEKELELFSTLIDNLTKASFT